MRLILAPFFFIGRILLWVFLFPVGIWRSLVHHRKKGQRRAEAHVEKVLAERERRS